MLEKYCQNLFKYRFLLFNLVSRDLKVKYRRSILGYLWSFLNPLLMMLVITAVFQNIFRFDISYYPIYYLAGSLIFGFIAEATSSSMTSIIQSSSLIKKVYIPKYIFPLEKVSFAFINMVLSLPALILIAFIIGMPFNITILLFPIPLIYVFIFSLGLGLFLSAFNIFFRDIGHLYSVWITAWMFLTPIFYPISILPDYLKKILLYNPAYLYINYFRELIINGNIPDLRYNILCLTISLLSLLIGFALFRSKQDKFILYI